MIAKPTRAALRVRTETRGVGVGIKKPPKMKKAKNRDWESDGTSMEGPARKPRSNFTSDQYVKSRTTSWNVPLIILSAYI